METPSNVEIGQLYYSPNEIQVYDCPDYVVALLSDISYRLSTIMWNKTQEEYDSPFDNTGNNFVCDVFEVHAYNWDEDVCQPYNFKCGDIEISWYKYLGRGCTMNKKCTPDEIVNMYNKCMQELMKMDKEVLEDEDFEA